MLGKRLGRRSMLLGAAALAGCDLGPDYRRPTLDLPERFAATPESGREAWPESGWWRAFGSAELNALIERARAYNTDLAAAAARVVQADAQARISGAPLLPSLSGTGNFNYNRTGTGLSRSRGVAVTTTQVGDLTAANVVTSSGGTRYFDSRSYALGLSAAYDLDFWGRNHANYEASRFAALASRFDQEVVALTVVASVALTYFAVLAAQDRLRVAERNLRSAENILGAYRARLTVGTASALDVSQQEALVAGQRANLPSFRNTAEQQRIALGLLLGTPPERIVLRGGSLEDLPLPPVAPGLTSELLARRPDVAFAEAQLQAANASIRAARAAFYPDVTLTAQGGLTSAALSTLTGPGTLVAQLAAALAQPIFDNGLRRGELNLAKGREQELVADYVKAVLQAFQDVEQALAAIRFAAEQEALEREAIRVAQRSADIAAAQLQAGTIDIITSLNTQQTLFNDLDLLTQIRLARFQALVNLFKALGGGWERDPKPL